MALAAVSDCSMLATPLTMLCAPLVSLGVFTSALGF